MMVVTLENAAGRLPDTMAMGEARDRDFNVLTIGKELLERSGGRLVMRFDLPIRDLHGSWYCEAYRGPGTGLAWNFQVRSAQQYGIPYWTGFNLQQRNTATVALSCCRDDVRIEGNMDQMRCVYHFTVTVAVVPETEPFQLLYSTAPKPWPELLAAWRKLVLPHGVPNFPDAAFLPVYCTWYAMHGAMTEAALDRNAELAADLGFGTFIVDDGWSYPEAKRACPETLAEGWYRDIGNWTVAEEKLPDFKKHVAYAQSLGLKYLLWAAPLFVGRASAEFQRAKSDWEREISLHEWDEVAVFDPESRGALQALRRLETLMRELELDGLKLDFLDFVPRSVDKPRGRSCERYFRKLTAALRAVKPDALIEFRQNYATPQMLEFATQFRAADVPFDFLSNFARLIQIRMMLGDGVPCHADPVFFHPEETAENVSHHMIAALAGVPMLSMELAALTDEQRAVIRNWLNFYRVNLAVFRSGHWTMRFDRGEPVFLAAETPEQAIVFVAQKHCLEEISADFAGRRLTALNLTGETLALPGGRACDCRGAATGGDAAPVGGRVERE